MSFNPPSTITFSSGGWFTNGRYYQHISNGLYSLYNSDGTLNSSTKDIKFTDSSGTLTLDVNPSTGTDAPASFNTGGSDVTSGTVVAGNTINLKASDGVVRATWTLSNFYTGGTSTEEVFVPDAKIVNYGGLTGLRFEQRSYPAASYELIGPTVSSTWSLTSQSSNLQYHISNLIAGTYYLWQDSVQVATLIARDKGKVHCNFW